MKIFLKKWNIKFDFFCCPGFRWLYFHRFWSNCFIVAEPGGGWRRLSPLQNWDDLILKWWNMLLLSFKSGLSPSRNFLLRAQPPPEIFFWGLSPLQKKFLAPPLIKKWFDHSSWTIQNLNLQLNWIMKYQNFNSNLFLTYFKFQTSMMAYERYL